MNEQFRIAHKLGLMFFHDTPLPEDVKAWAISQLHAKSPALGIKKIKLHPKAKVIEWPKSLQPDLLKRDNMFNTYKENMKRNELGLEGFTSQAAKEDNRLKNALGDTDQLKFAHRNVYGEDQVKLRFTAFWANHFTTGNIFSNQNHIGHAIDEAILANLNGNFSHMLYKMTTHSSMLTYLDNCWSCGANSQTAFWAKENGNQAGLNDNLGRELLELHTVSPTAKYTETDIKNAANILSGWGIWPGRIGDGDELLSTAQRHKKLLEWGGTLDSWDFFKKTHHEPGTKSVLGKAIPAGKGGLKQLTDFLASHGHTINFVSFKLAQHFVSDNPSKSDIDYIVNAWKRSNGNLDQIHTAVIERAISSKEPKFQWPMTWLFQVIRLSGATYFKGWNEFKVYNPVVMDAREIFDELGQSLWHERQPDGYSSDKKEWLSGEMFERRIRFAEAIYSGGYPTNTPDEIMDRIGANETTRSLVNSFNGRKDQFIALMCSPELMGLENA
jgi:uncharacterized protein (DUF1800 family)